MKKEQIRKEMFRHIMERELAHCDYARTEDEGKRQGFLTPKNSSRNFVKRYDHEDDIISEEVYCYNAELSRLSLEEITTYNKRGERWYRSTYYDVVTDKELRYYYEEDKEIFCVGSKNNYITSISFARGGRLRDRYKVSEIFIDDDIKKIRFIGMPKMGGEKMSNSHIIKRGKYLNL